MGPKGTGKKLTQPGSAGGASRRRSRPMRRSPCGLSGRRRICLDDMKAAPLEFSLSATIGEDHARSHRHPHRNRGRDKTVLWHSRPGAARAPCSRVAAGNGRRRLDGCRPARRDHLCARGRACERGRLRRYEGRSVPSTDGGGHWVSANGNLPIAGPRAALVLALAVDGGSPPAVYASVLLHGVFKSVNGGQTWAARRTWA